MSQTDSRSDSRSDDQADVVDILTTDHREALELLTEARASTDAEHRRELADMLISELVRHSVAEEMYVYPVMRKQLPNGDEAVEHDTSEHKELEQTMKQLESADTTDPEFDRLLGQLERILVDHVEDEEGEQFPLLRKHIGREDLVKIGGQVQTAKKLAPTRPHPGAPNKELFHKLAGPGVGMVDRLRDRLSGRSTT